MKNNETRKLIKLSDIIIIVVILIICVGFIILMRLKTDKNVVAEIYSGSNIVKRIDLASASDEIFKLDNNSSVSFQIENHKIRFVDTDCPDKLCENCGYISFANQVAICLPNKILLKIVGNNKDVDIIVN